MNNKDTQQIAKKIRSIRERRNLSQEGFAEILEVPRPTVSNWENGKAIPTSEQLIKINKNFNESIDLILGANVSEEQVIPILQMETESVYVRAKVLEEWVIPDTSVLIKRPRIIEDLLRKYNKVIISETVISELNHIKDNKKHREKQSAWLAMSGISEHLNEGSKLVRESDVSKKEKADDRIIDMAIAQAKANQNASIYVLSDDIYFSLQGKPASNLYFLSLSEYSKVQNKNLSAFDQELTQEFFRVVKSKKIDKAKQMELEKVDINKADNTKEITPLIQAIINKDSAMIDFLLSRKNIDINKKDVWKYELPPISHAIQQKDINTVKKLVELGCDFDLGSTGKNWGNTPLMIAAWHGLKDIVEYLIQQGACLNQQDSNGYTPLIKSCINKHPDTARILVSGTDKSIRCKKGKTAQDYARGKKEFEEIFSESNDKSGMIQ